MGGQEGFIWCPAFVLSLAIRSKSVKFRLKSQVEEKLQRKVVA